MKPNEINSNMRAMFKQLNEEDGLKKKPLCDVTLGEQAMPQFENFLKGQELGHGPLGRIFSGLDYELHVVPVRKSDLDTIKKLEVEFLGFLEVARQNLLDFINNRPNPRPVGEGSVNKLLKNQVDMLLETLAE